MNNFTQRLIEKQSKVGGREYLSANRTAQSLLNSVKSRAPSNEQLEFASGEPAAEAVVYDQITMHSCTLPFFVKGAFLLVAQCQNFLHSQITKKNAPENSKKAEKKASLHFYTPRIGLCG